MSTIPKMRQWSLIDPVHIVSYLYLSIQHGRIMFCLYSRYIFYSWKLNAIKMPSIYMYILSASVVGVYVITGTEFIDFSSFQIITDSRMNYKVNWTFLILAYFLWY